LQTQTIALFYHSGKKSNKLFITITSDGQSTTGVNK